MTRNERHPAWIKVFWGLMILGALGLLGLGLLVTGAVGHDCVVGRVHDYFASLNERERADYLTRNQALLDELRLPDDLRIVQVGNFSNSPEDGGVVEGMTTSVELRAESSIDPARALTELADALKAAGWSVEALNDTLLATRDLATIRTWPNAASIQPWIQDTQGYSFGMWIDHAAKAPKPPTRGCYPDF